METKIIAINEENSSRLHICPKCAEVIIWKRRLGHKCNRQYLIDQIMKELSLPDCGQKKMPHQVIGMNW